MDNRSTILQCALELFASRGYDAVGVQEIVEAAGITKPTLYHYFGSKAGLLKAILDAYQKPFYEQFAAACAYNGYLPNTLETLARTCFGFAREHPVYYRMQLALYFAPRDSEGHQMIARMDEEQYALLEKVFATAVREYGNMRGKQTQYAAIFMGMLNTCIGLYLNGYAELDESLLKSVVRQFQYGIYS